MKLYKVMTLAFFTLAGTLQAQEGFLRGSLEDPKEQTIPFATVTVMELPDSTVVTGTTTDMDGLFELETPSEGKYLLRLSAIGYTSVYTDPFQVSSSEFSRDFGTVVLPAEVTMLNEVMVEAWRPRIEFEAGKMVVRVEGTAMAAGSTAFEVVSKSPGISADHEGNLQLNGKSGVGVLINGRETYLSPAELKGLLETLPAEDIENIEIIHNPSAKYPAAGTAGIINISLKENSSLGLNGSLYGGVEFRGEDWYNSGGNLNYGKGKWNTFLNLNFNKTGFHREQEVERTFTTDTDYDYFRQKGHQLETRWVPSIRAGADYQINAQHSVGFMANLSWYDERGDWDTETGLGTVDQGDLLHISARNQKEETFNTGRYNLHYTGKLDTVGTTLTADLDYVELGKDQDSYFTNYYDYDLGELDQTEYLFNRSVSDYNILAFKSDLVLPLSDRSGLTTGIKASRVISESDLKFFLGQEGDAQLDESRSNNFRYEEQIYAAHFTYTNRLNDTWDVQLGLRAEKTVGEGISPTTGEVNTKDYLNLFPNVQINQAVSEDYEVNYSFSRRIKRPDYSVLNPFLFYLDPYSYIVGNPQLDAELTSSYKISQNLFGKYQLMLAYDHTERPMEEYPSTDFETGRTIFTTANLDSEKSFSATLVVPVEIGSFWNSTNTLIANQSNYDMYYGNDLVENDVFHYSIQSNHQVRLPWDVKMEINGSFLGPMNSGIYEIGSRWFVDAGLKKSFLEDRLDVTVKGTDIFKSHKLNVYAAYPGSIFDMSQHFYTHGVSINLRYKLKNFEVKKESRQNSLEELDRAGG